MPDELKLIYMKQKPQNVHIMISIFIFHAVFLNVPVLECFVNVCQVEETTDDRGVCARALYDYQAGVY